MYRTLNKIISQPYINNIKSIKVLNNRHIPIVCSVSLCLCTIYIPYAVLLLPVLSDACQFDDFGVYCAITFPRIFSHKMMESRPVILFKISSPLASFINWQHWITRQILIMIHCYTLCLSYLEMEDIRICTNQLINQVWSIRKW